MISEQDKTFLARLKVPQMIVSEQIEEKLIKPRLYYELYKRNETRKLLGETDELDEYLRSFDSWLATEPKVPKVEWKSTFKQDETQTIANTVTLLNAGIINHERARVLVGEVPEINKGGVETEGITDPISHETKIAEVIQEGKENSIETEQPQNQGNNMQNEMQRLRGSTNVTQQKDDSNRNVTDVKDPSQLGGSRAASHELKGEKGEISQKSSGLGGKNKP
jgi:hypothetical protein